MGEMSGNLVIAMGPTSKHHTRGIVMSRNM